MGTYLYYKIHHAHGVHNTALSLARPQTHTHKHHQIMHLSKSSAGSSPCKNTLISMLHVKCTFHVCLSMFILLFPCSSWWIPTDNISLSEVQHREAVAHLPRQGSCEAGAWWSHRTRLEGWRLAWLARWKWLIHQLERHMDTQRHNDIKILKLDSWISKALRKTVYYLLYVG